MGLTLAKLYLNNEKSAKDFLVHYNGISWTLKPGQRYFFPDDDYLEIIYTGDEINFTYNGGERLLTNYIDDILHFSLIDSLTENFERKSILYPLKKNCKCIYVGRISEKDYRKANKNILARYMEYRD